MTAGWSRPRQANDHDALYRGFPNSYGTLGYALSLTIELEPVRPYVHLRHFPLRHPGGLHGRRSRRSPRTAATAGTRRTSWTAPRSARTRST